MFVDEVLVLDVPVAAAQDRLLAFHVDGGVQDAATFAFREGHALLQGDGFTGWTDQVAVHSVPAYLRGPTTILPLRWVVTGTSGDIFPAVDANLELDQAPDGRSRLTFRGSYRPPWGQLGFVLDQQRLQDAARATAGGLLERVADAMLARRPRSGASSSHYTALRNGRGGTDGVRLLARPPRASGSLPSA
jgi:hypothetical protein